MPAVRGIGQARNDGYPFVIAAPEPQSMREAIQGGCRVKPGMPITDLTFDNTLCPGERGLEAEMKAVRGIGQARNDGYPLVIAAPEPQSIREAILRWMPGFGFRRHGVSIERLHQTLKPTPE